MRIREAKLLLDNEFFQGAYHVAGYSIECALKACIAKKTKEHDFPDLKLVKDSYEHDLKSLLRTAGLEPEFLAEAQTNNELASNWKIVAGWSVGARYQTADVLDLTHYAGALYSAIIDPENGVLPWLKKRW